jgi:Skp family chaperone for outer membrane proteins
VAVVVDMQAVLRDAAAATALRSIEAEERLALRQRLDALSDALQQEEELLTRQRDDMDKEAFDVRVRDFDQRVRAARQEAQETSIGFQNRFAEAFAALEKEAMPVIIEIMGEHAAQVAFDKRSVLVVADAADVTAEVIRRLDATLPAAVARDLLPPMPGPR